MKLIAVIEKSSDKFYSIYTENNDLEWGFAGYGESVEKAQNDYMASINEMRDMAKEEAKPFPSEIDVEFRYDIPSFFNYFDWINVSAFAKKAGINESKMRAYKAGVAFASEKTLNKIKGTLKSMCEQMSAATF